MIEKQRPFRLRCPKCEYPQYCGCESCRKNGLLPEGIKPWITHPNSYECGNCGYTMSVDAWMDESERLYQLSLEQIK